MSLGAVVTLAVLVVLFIALNVVSGANDRKLDNSKARKAALIDQNQALNDELVFAKTDDYVIRIARDELGMIMPGEYEYVGSGN